MRLFTKDIRKSKVNNDLLVHVARSYFAERIITLFGIIWDNQ